MQQFEMPHPREHKPPYHICIKVILRDFCPCYVKFTGSNTVKERKSHKFPTTWSGRVNVHGG